MKAVKAILLTLLLPALAAALVQAYSVAPKTAAWSGWAPSQFPNNYVSQLVTANFDSLSYVELFAGDKGAGGTYTATITPLEGGNPVATSDPATQTQSCSWVKFDEWTFVGSFTKGKQYEFKFTRSGILGTLPALRISD